MFRATHVVDARPGLPFYVAGNRYRTDPPRDAGYTLLLLHAIGMHKETWQPVVQALFDLSVAHTAIREVWAIECPNHGQSTVLNDEELQRNWRDEWDGEIYPRATHAFLTSSPGGVDFSKHKLILVGHSVGGCAAVQLTALRPRLPIDRLILLDGAVVRKCPARDYMDALRTQITWVRPDVWRSRQDAARWLAAAPGYKNWDPAVRELYVEYGLKEHRAAKYPAPYTFNGVTLACDKSYETACFRMNAHYDPAWEQLQQLYVHGPPVHMVLCDKDEFEGSTMKEDLLTAHYGGGPASVQYIKKSSHLFVQQRPEATARAIWNVLKGGIAESAIAKL